MVKIISIDGGGIRGLIPAIVLSEIEKRAGKHIAEMFDLIAGTSTGGILALGLAKADSEGKPQYFAHELAKIYEERGDEIFSTTLWRKFASTIRDEKYPAEGIEKILQEYFGEDWLGDVVRKPNSQEPVDLLITAYELARRDTWFFKSRNAKRGDYNFKLKDVARSTSAAPTFFEPAAIHSEDGTEYFMVDGGVYANNPAMCAYVEGQKNYGREQDFLLVSIGTGDIFRPISYESVKDTGALGWVSPLIDMMFDGTDNVIHNQLNIIFGNKSANSRYFRFQREIQNEFADMDNAEKDNIRYLVGVGQKIILENSDQIDELCKLLT